MTIAMDLEAAQGILAHPDSVVIVMDPTLAQEINHLDLGVTAM